MRDQTIFEMFRPSARTLLEHPTIPWVRMPHHQELPRVISDTDLDVIKMRIRYWMNVQPMYTATFTVD